VTHRPFTGSGDLWRETLHQRLTLWKFDIAIWLVLQVIY
jgi:hypothetical protein